MNIKFIQVRIRLQQALHDFEVPRFRREMQWRVAQSVHRVRVLLEIQQPDDNPRVPISAGVVQWRRIIMNG
jgi:hypothetical protein